MLLLNNALKKYKTLDVMGDIDEEDDGNFSLCLPYVADLLLFLTSHGRFERHA